MNKVHRQTSQIEVAGYTIYLKPTRGRRMSLRLGRESAELQLLRPEAVTDEEVRAFVEQSLPWIQRNVAAMEARLEQSLLPKEYTDAAEMILLGERYHLSIGSCEETKVWIDSSTNRLYFESPTASPAPKVSLAVRTYLFSYLYDLIDVFSRRYAKEMGVSLQGIKLRRMTSRWGSCNVKTAVITYNTKLLHYPLSCIEYVVVHELAHLIEANHSPAFWAVVSEVLPTWKNERKRLKEAAFFEGY